MGGRVLSSKVPLVGIILILLTISLTMGGTVAGGERGGDKARVVSALGVTKVQGQDVFVDVLVLVRPGQDAKAAVQAGLESQGARPLKEAQLGSGGGFTLIGPVWDFSAAVTQHYNDGSGDTQTDPEIIDTRPILNTGHGKWEGVGTASVNLDLDAANIDRCPSLIRRCRGPQFFDQNNDVAWVDLGINKGFLILGAVLFAESNISGPEADMALSSNSLIDWANDGSDVDITTVIIHELGHLLGLGHSFDDNAVMAEGYRGVRQDLTDDDEEGVTFLYDSTIAGSVTGTVMGSNGPIEGATVMLEGTILSDPETDGSGAYTIPNVPDPVTYTVIASAEGFESATMDRLFVDGGAVANFTLTPSDGEDGNGGGGACPPAREARGKC